MDELLKIFQAPPSYLTRIGCGNVGVGMHEHLLFAEGVSYCTTRNELIIEWVLTAWSREELDSKEAKATHLAEIIDACQVFRQEYPILSIRCKG